MLLLNEKIENGQVVRLKARAVVIGSQSRKGVHYSQTFSPTVDPTITKLMTALAAVEDLEIRAYDAKQAYLSAQPEAAVYVRPPPGFEHPDDPSMVWELHSSQYGLPSSSRDFWLLTCRSMTRQGFIKVAHDGTVWIKRVNEKFLVVCTHVDDDFMVGNSSAMFDEVVRECAKDGINFETAHELNTDGSTMKYVGCVFERNRTERTIRMQQTEYVEHLVTNYEQDHDVVLRMHDTPMPADIRIDPRECIGEPSANARNAQIMRGVLGLCLYLHTRPEIQYSVVELARIAHNPNAQHMALMEHLLGYLKRTKHLGLTFGGRKFMDPKVRNQITAFSDASWGSCLETRRSMTCFTIMLNGAAIYHKCKRQKIVATSTAESE